MLTVNENGGKYTPLSANKIHADVAYTGTGVPEGILQSVTSTVSANGTVTNMGESLNKVTAGSFAGVSHAGGTEVAGSWNYIIQDSSWKNSGAEYLNGYVDLIGNEMPKGFITAESNNGLVWDKNKQAYIYKGEAVDYSNVYVIDGKIGVFTNKEGTKVYTGTVYGKYNEILMTVKDKDNKFYSYWAAEVTDPSATMATYRVEDYNKNLAELVENDDKLYRNDIKEVTLTKSENSATIGLMRNGDEAVDGAITVTSGGGTGGSGASHDTFVKISNAADKEGKTFATGSKVEAIVDKGATTGIKINGEYYTIKSGSKVSVTQNADKKTTIITVDGTETTITDTDTTYTKGDGIEISDANVISVSKNLTGMQSIKGAGTGAGSISFEGSNVKVNQNTFNSDGRIQGVVAGVDDTDAVNVGQLNATVQAGNTDTHIKAGEYGVGADNKVNMDVVDKNGNKVDTVTIKDVAKASDVGDVNKIARDIRNKEGKTTVVDAVNNLNDKVGDLQYSKVEKGEIADGDSTTTAIGKLDQKLTDVAATAAKHTKVEGSSNITVTNTAKEGEAANYKVELNKNIDVNTVTANRVTTGQTVMNNDGLKVGENVSVTGTAVTAGQASISNEGLAVGPNTSLKADELKVDGKNYIDKDGLNANGQHITNVKAGEADTDAVNYGQLKDTNNHIDRVENQVVNNTNRISNLDNRVNKVGAGAAALAALHPLDFDPDAKWDFAAGYGNYRGANAAAVGAYYRPNEDTMFSVGGTFGNGENMVNAGVSFKLGSGSSHVSTSRVAMAKEIKELRGELEAMKSAMLDANAGKKIDTSKLQLFPDVPQNHWAYEYVAQLAGNGMIEGYPDGNFAGDRPMTRYEFAAILYRAMTKGAVLSDKILSEFSHELEYFTVDTIAKDKAGNPTIQRVRTVKENKNK